MNSEKEKTTAPGSLVGASEGQSNVNHNNSILDCIKEINEERGYCAGTNGIQCPL